MMSIRNRIQALLEIDYSPRSFRCGKRVVKRVGSGTERCPEVPYRQMQGQDNSESHGGRKLEFAFQGSKNPGVARCAGWRFECAT